MNISLTGTEDLPTKAYISIRAGDTRRQAPVSKQEVFTFPSGPYKCVVVDVFEKLGSAQVSLAGLDFSEERRRDERVSLTRPDGSKFGVGLRMEMHDAGVPVKSKSKAATKAKDYLEDHGVQSLLQEMVHALLAKQPEDPVCFMSDFIDARKNKATPKTSKTPTSATSAWTSVAEGIMQGLGEEELLGFPVDVCPEELPDISKHFSLMAEALKKDPSIYHSLRQQRTEKGVTFAKVIKPGMDNRGHRMIKTAGFYAGDAESYTTFGPLFDPIICQRYGGPPAGTRQPSDTDPLKVSAGSVDPEGNYIVSVQARVCRNLASFRFPPACSLEERREVERLLAGAFLDFAGDLQGEYLPLAGSQSFAARPGGMGLQEEVELEGLGALFREPDSTIALSSGLGRHWPDARGVYKTDNSSLWAWINEEDHLRLISSQDGSDLQTVFARLCSCESAVRQALQQAGHDFAHSERFGFLSAAPGNSGTAFTANVSVRLPRLMKQLGFRALCGQLKLQAHQSGVGVWTLSNSERFGSTEAQQVQVVINACRELVDKERRLELDELRITPEPADQPDQDAEESDSGSDEYSTGVGDIPGLGEEEYPGFSPVECPDEMPDISMNFSLMSDVLKRDLSIYHKLKNRKTAQGVSFAKVIKPGVDIRGHAMIKTMGVVAGDEESYEAFGELMDQVISLRHGGFGGSMRHCTDLSAARVDPAPVDPTGRIVVSTRFSAVRNLRGFRFPSACSSDERQELERVTSQALLSFTGELKGEYHPLRGSTSYKGKPNGMEQVQEERLRNAKVLFQEPDSSMLLASGMGRHWPDARGIFANEEADVAAWVNEEDHLRLLVTHSGAGVAEAFLRFCHVHKNLQSELARLNHKFVHSERLGYITSCPSNLGSGLRVSVTVQVPLLSKRKDWKEICKTLQLNARGIGGPKSSHWELSNMLGLGASEVDLVNCVARGCRYIVGMEEALERDEEPPLPGLGAEPLPGLAVDRELPPELPNLWGNRSVLAEVLRQKPSIYCELRQLRTSTGVSFAQAIKPGFDVCSCAPSRDALSFGLVAGDAESYQTFASVFNPCLEAFHCVKLSGRPHPLDLDAAAVRGDNIDPADERVLSVRVRASRNLGGLRMSPACSFDERREVERVLAGALLELSGPLEGEYFPLADSRSFPARPEGMDAAEQLRLSKAGLLFQEPKAHGALAAGVGRDWPDARGVFAVKNGDLAAWVNEEEHLTLLASRKDSDVKAAFACLCAAEKALSSVLQQDGRSFARSDNLGFLTAMPERLGTGMSVSATLRLRGLANTSELSKLCAELGVKVVSQAHNGTVEIATQATFGVSEASLVDTMLGACRELLATSD